MSTAKPKDRAKPTRWLRRVLAVILLWNLGSGIQELAAGRLFWLVSLAGVLMLAAVMAFQTYVIRRLDRQRLERLRPRPDYSSIAAMEEDIYGETFEHEGAPEPASGSVAELHAMMDDLADRATKRRRVTLAEQFEDDRRAMRELADKHRATRPDTTEPATIGQYAAWLEGYVRRGGKVTHVYDYPWSRARFRYASSPLTIDSDYEYGACSRSIVVAAGVTAGRTRPSGGFGGWAHTNLYFMHGCRTNADWVPVYSDPEFDAYRGDEHRADGCWESRS